MNKQETYDFLASKGIEFEITEHPAFFNMQLIDTMGLPHPGDQAKNLFLRDDKKRNYYLVTMRGHKSIDLKEFQKTFGTRRLGFASESDLLSILGLATGSVTPLGLLNDEERKVQLFIDEDFFEGSGCLGVHPNDNTATVWLPAKVLVKLVEEHGNTVTTFSA